MIIAIAAAAFLIGFSKAGVGGILGPFVTVLVALTIPADKAIGLLLPMLIIADVFTVAAHWQGWDRQILLRLLAPAAAGIVVGGFVISNVSEPVLRRIIAVAMLVFVVFYVLNSKLGLAARLARRHAWPVGLIAGFTSAIAHLGAPPVVTYLMTTDLKPRRFVATSAAVFAGMNLLKLPAYLFAGLFDGGLIAATWWTWLAIPVGVVGGRVFVGHINRLWFDRMTLGLLVGGAFILLVT